MLLRARGHGLPAYVIQFIKSSRSGELELLDRLGVPLIRGGFGFVPAPDDPAFALHREAAQNVLARAIQLMQDHGSAFFLLDEGCTAFHRGLITSTALLSLSNAAADDSVVVFTGRGAPSALLESADTVTTMCATKHALDVGCLQQAGVEF
jgi:cob(I)alamin adenosyltransferase